MPLETFAQEVVPSDTSAYHSPGYANGTLTTAVALPVLSDIVVAVPCGAQGPLSPNTRSRNTTCAVTEVLVGHSDAVTVTCIGWFATGGSGDTTSGVGGELAA